MAGLNEPSIQRGPPPLRIAVATCAHPQIFTRLLKDQVGMGTF